ncbi:tannase and feruloyl esterase, partial [Aspergillus sclerotiicarbonarius CBS 121057]
TYNDATGEYEVAEITFIGAEWVNMFLDEIDTTSSLSITNVTVDTFRAWILEGMQKFAGTLNTMWTDLSDFQDSGGKAIHYHGEADPNIPAISSVVNQEQVHRVMFPSLNYTGGVTRLHDFHRLYLVPGAAHCTPSAANGPYPQTILRSIIDWVEQDIVPITLNATILQGNRKGQSQPLCTFPLRPMWRDNST